MCGKWFNEWVESVGAALVSLVVTLCDAYDRLLKESGSGETLLRLLSQNLRLANFCKHCSFEVWQGGEEDLRLLEAFTLQYSALC